MANKHSARAEKVYVKVNSDFDSTGYIQPKSITWADGRTFMIEKIKDYRPAATFRPGFAGACYPSCKPCSDFASRKTFRTMFLVRYFPNIIGS